MITEKQYEEIANGLGIEVAVVKAVHEVEADGKAFNENGTIVILFEGHKFYQFLEDNGKDAKALSKQYPTLIYKVWTRKHYGKGDTFEDRQIEEHKRFRKAIEIDADAAFRATSFGAFQIMGFNSKSLGFKTASDLYYYLKSSEANQLKVFGIFCQVNNLVRHLRSKNWAAFARGYNGRAYAENKYDIKLEKAYLKFAK